MLWGLVLANGRLVVGRPCKILGALGLLVVLGMLYLILRTPVGPAERAGGGPPPAPPAEAAWPVEGKKAEVASAAPAAWAEIYWHEVTGPFYARKGADPAFKLLLHVRAEPAAAVRGVQIWLDGKPLKVLYPSEGYFIKGDPARRVLWWDPKLPDPGEGKHAYAALPVRADGSFGEAKAREVIIHPYRADPYSGKEEGDMWDMLLKAHREDPDGKWAGVKGMTMEEVQRYRKQPGGLKAVPDQSLIQY